MTSHTAFASALSPEYALLGFLALRPAHGYELHQQLAAELGQIWNVSQSQAYNILNRLEVQSYITGAVQEQEKLPARRQFRLTPAGRRHFMVWLHTPERCSVRYVRVGLTTRLYFARALEPDVVPELIQQQEDEIRAGLARLQARRAELPPDQLFNHLGLDLRLRQLTSLLDWLESCRAALAQVS